MNNLCKLSLVLSLAVFPVLQGCKTTADEDPAIYRAILDKDAPADLAVPKPGEPLSLLTAIQLANKSSESLAIKGESYLQALINKNLAADAFLPTVNASGSANFNGGSTYTPNHSSSSSLGASYNLFNGFKDLASIKQADLNAEQQKALLLDQQSALILNVAQTYYSILSAERSIKVLENTIGVMNERLRDTNTKYKLDMATLLDIAQTESQLASTRVSLTNSKTQAKNGRVTLAFLIGVTRADFVLTDNLSIPETIPTLEECFDNAQNSRLDLIASKNAMDSSQINIEKAIEKYYPSLSLNLSRALHSDPESTIDWTAGLSLSLPIFSAGQIEEGVRTAWSQYRTSQLSYNALKRQINQDTETALNNLNSSAEKLKNLTTQLESSKQSLDLSERSFQLGKATNLDRMNAQDSLLNAQLQLANEELNQKSLYLSLLRQTGQLTLTHPALPSAQPATQP